MAPDTAGSDVGAADAHDAQRSFESALELGQLLTVMAAAFRVAAVYLGRHIPQPTHSRPLRGFPMYVVVHLFQLASWPMLIAGGLCLAVATLQARIAARRR